jgi:2'-5' RNA ligase
MRTRRIFVAAMPPPDTALALQQAVFADLRAAGRPVPLEQIHLTLQFIGKLTDRDLDQVVESVGQAIAGLKVQQLKPERIATFPEKPPARLIATVTSCPNVLREAQRRLSLRLARFSHAPHDGDFVPHFTLVRFSPPQADYVRDRPCTVPPFLIREIHVLESILRPEGSRYVSLHQFTLPD